MLKLGNQMFVRHYLWLNYPQDRQLMGIQFKSDRPELALCGELVDLGFEWHVGYRMWVIWRVCPDRRKRLEAIG